MPEGVARVNQQVVDGDYWTRSDMIASLGERTREPAAQATDLVDHDERRALIREAVEDEIIPRLASANGPHLTQDSQTAGNEAEVLRLADLLLSQADDIKVAAYLTSLHEAGATLEHLYLNVLQAAARHIGELWCADLCTFIDVTLAIATMRRMLQVFESGFQANQRPANAQRQVLLAPIPGEQHTFGLAMVIQFFRRAGWNVWSMPQSSAADILDAVRTTPIALVGFSGSNGTRIDLLADLIPRIRRESCNAEIKVMVGGPIFLENPTYVAQVGADAMGDDALQALARAERFFSDAAGP